MMRNEKRSDVGRDRRMDDENRPRRNVRKIRGRNVQSQRAVHVPYRHGRHCRMSDSRERRRNHCRTVDPTGRGHPLDECGMDRPIFRGYQKGRRKKDFGNRKPRVNERIDPHLQMIPYRRERNTFASGRRITRWRASTEQPGPCERKSGLP